MDFIEQCRGFLNFINNNPSVFLRRLHLSVQQTVIFLVLEGYPAQKQVYPVGARENSLKLCTLPGSARSE